MQDWQSEDWTAIEGVARRREAPDATWRRGPSIAANLAIVRRGGLLTRRASSGRREVAVRREQQARMHVVVLKTGARRSSSEPNGLTPRAGCEERRLRTVPNVVPSLAQRQAPPHLPHIRKLLQDQRWPTGNGEATG